MIEIKKYTANDAAEWDSIVVKSRNGTFLHYRKYMDYHSDRFQDFSLIISRLGKAVGVFPANVTSQVIHSHGGLTFGGLISMADLCANETLEVFEKIGIFYKERGINAIVIKIIPYVFHQYPCQEDLYALFRVGAKIIRRDASSVIALKEEYKYSKGRKWSINKARKADISIEKSTDPIRFHVLLTEVLRKFDATPTHSLIELSLLMFRFPNNISLYEASISGEMQAGAIIYDFGHVVHTQYLATSDIGREIGALDFLLADLIGNIYADRKYFSFGISTEQQGAVLNTGLIAQKEGFGARTIAHDFYEWIL
jgi:hypothetical protein